MSISELNASRINFCKQLSKLAKHKDGKGINKANEAIADNSKSFYTAKQWHNLPLQMAICGTKQFISQIFLRPNHNQLWCKRAGPTWINAHNQLTLHS